MPVGLVVLGSEVPHSCRKERVMSGPTALLLYTSEILMIIKFCNNNIHVQRHANI
jgi:hypothetical protein